MGGRVPRRGYAGSEAGMASWKLALRRASGVSDRGTFVSSRGLVRPGSGSDRWFEIKTQVHHKLLNSLTPDQLKDLSKESVRGQIGMVGGKADRG